MVCVSVKSQLAFSELLPCGEGVRAARSGRVSQAMLAAGTACRDLLRALPRMEIAILIVMFVLANA